MQTARGGRLSKRGTRPSRLREAEDALWVAHGLARHERRVPLRRLGVEVRVQEVGEGPAVLFVPALLTTGSAFVPLVAHLQDFRCLLLDRPGTGTSDPVPQPPTGSDLASFSAPLLADVLDGLGLDRAHLVGGSLGGALALYAAAALPDRVGRMVALACPVMVPNMVAPWFLRLLATPAGGHLITALLRTPAGILQIARLLGHGASVSARRFPEGVLETISAALRYTATARHELALLRTMIGRRGMKPEAVIPPSTLASVTTPTALYCGSTDPFNPPYVVDALVASMPDATAEMIASSGHLPWLDDPHRAAAFIRTHLHGPGRAD